MSSMLEQSIIDASALKEAAIKNAEKSIVEKYSHKIKEAVDNIIEQDEEDDLGLDLGLDDEMDDGSGISMSVGSDEGGLNSDIVDDLPLAASDGEKLCDCPDNEEEIEIDFDDLQRQMMGDEAGGADVSSIDREDFADDLPIDDDDDLPLEEFLIKEEDLEEKEKISEEEEEEELEEDINVDEDLSIEEMVDALAEELTVDLDVVPSGWQGSNPSEMEEAEDIAGAKENAMTEEDKAEAAAKAKEENLAETRKKQLVSLKSNLKKSINENEKLREINNKLKTFLVEFKNKMQDIQLTNSKLLYKNRVLSNISLNERQKDTIVEAISKSESIESAKTIYETLKSTVASGPSKKTPMQSLGEVIQKRSSSVFVLKESRKPLHPETTRWQKLAGISKTK